MAFLSCDVASLYQGVGGFDVLAYGVGQARRGWLEKKDVPKTRPLPDPNRVAGVLIWRKLRQ